MKVRFACLVRYSFLAVSLCAGTVHQMFSQAIPVSEGATSIGHGTEPLVAPVNGLNGSLDFTTQHNSATGWANVLTPNVSFRFNRHLFVSSSVPLYLSDNAYVPTTTKGVTTYSLVSTRHALGDTVMSGAYETTYRDVNYLGTIAVALPTGNSRFGLTANQVTYNVTNHFDYNLGPFDPEIEFGIGDSSSLTNPTVRKTYTAVGSVANFVAGTGIDFPFGTTLDLQAYEDLPIGNQNVYGTVTKKRKGKTVSKQVLQGTGAAEDNGFTAEFDVPVGTHLMLAGTYERSLIQSLDTVSVGITWTLRRPKLTHARSN